MARPELAQVVEPLVQRRRGNVLGEYLAQVDPKALALRHGSAGEFRVDLWRQIPDQYVHEATIPERTLEVYRTVLAGRASSS